MRVNIILFLMLQCILPTYISAQVSIGTGDPPHESAILDLQASNKGFLGPRVALTGKYDRTTIPNAASGLLVINTSQPDINLPEEERVYPNIFYYWVEGNNPGWERFIGHDELEYRIEQEITRWSMPLPVMFNLNGSDMLSSNRPGILNFMSDANAGSAKKLPLVETFNHSEGNVSLKDQDTIIFKPGIYNIVFAYLFIPTTPSAVTCNVSSYFMDFPFYPDDGSGRKEVRVYSNTYHLPKDSASHAATINFVAPIEQTTKWGVHLGAGASDCTKVNGLSLPNRNTFLYITRVGNW